MTTINKDMDKVLEFMGNWDREESLVLIAHAMVINICLRRETLLETLHDVDQLFEQVKNLVKWNYGNLRDMTGDTSVYYFSDPAQAKAKMQ